MLSRNQIYGEPDQLLQAADDMNLADKNEARDINKIVFESIKANANFSLTRVLQSFKRKQIAASFPHYE
jgi:hypothetical protein